MEGAGTKRYPKLTCTWPPTFSWLYTHAGAWDIFSVYHMYGSMKFHS